MLEPYEQVVLAHKPHEPSFSSHKLWRNTLMIPAYACALSALSLLLFALFLSKPVRRLLRKTAQEEEPQQRDSEPLSAPRGMRNEIKKHISGLGGPTVFVYFLLRLVGSLALLGLSITSLVITETDREENNHSNHGLLDALGKWGKKRRRRHRSESLTLHEWLQVAMCMSYLYITILSLVSLCTTRKWRNRISRHLAALLFLTFCVYFYRDLLPYATYGYKPHDRYEGTILTAKMIVLTLVSVVFPLVFPRQYVPVDPKNPSEPNPEQTASILSMVTYHFMDKIVWRAYRVPHLSYEQLPPLADYDAASVLTSRSFPHLDPSLKGNNRHIFWGLLRTFRFEYSILAVMVTIQVVMSFAAPLGINRLLNYIETGGEGSIVKPWFWIIWLFLGPVVGSLAMQFYIFFATRTLVRVECIITQLVFEHSLRIRVKSEAGSTSSASRPATAAPTPDNASIADERDSGSEDSDATRAASSAAGKKTGSNESPSPSITSTTVGDDSAASNLVGKINNLVTTDLNNVVDGRDFLIPLLYIPLQIILCIVFLYQVLGWSAFVGMAVILCLFPIPGYIAKMVQKVQDHRLKRTDARVQTVTETMNVLRMIKLFGWEKQMEQRIEEKREAELKWIWLRQILELTNQNLNFIIPLATMIASYTTYTLVMKQPLNASIVFSSMAVFDMLRDQLHMAFASMTMAIQGKVSMDRINTFLNETELLDEFAEKFDVHASTVHSPEDKQIGFRDAVFSWTSEAEDGTLTPSRRRFKLRIEDELLFKQGGINLIIGPTGSGKSSLLMALLGEMHFIPSGPGSWFNLPRGNGVAYAAQESWVQNETIRENILFGSPYDETRYKKVLRQCALERDLELFEAGDETEVGEKGLTLSGGQKARITLARAIYSPAQVLLLDDVLAALDVHTSKWIIEKCFSGDLVKGRTVLLVTHNVALATPVADFVVSVATDGTILTRGTVSEALAHDKALAEEFRREQEIVEQADEESDTAAPAPERKSDGKLTVAEEIAEGHVSWDAIKLYLRGLGGKHPTLFFVTYLAGIFGTHMLLAYQVYFLGQWAAEYDNPDSHEVSVPYYLTVYSVIVAMIVIIYTCAFIMYLYGCIRASRSIHQQLVESVIGTNLRWLDTTPTSRVITRCTQDVRAVDGPISERLGWLIEMTDMMIIRLLAVFLTAPLFLFAGIAIFVAGGACGQVYIKAQLSVKREMSNAKSPVLGHFGAAIAGLTSIRAYSAQKSFKAESLKRINRYTRSARTYYNLNRWICVRVDTLGALFSASLAIYLIYIRGGSSSGTGFTLNMAVSFSSIILWWIRVLNEFEVQGNSLERIQEYIEIEHEPKATEEGKPPAAWPTSGDIRVEELSARYSLDGPKVLHNLSFHIKSGERVGVVGRTGSGKSSLTLSLLRCIFTEGEVYYDGQATSKINLDALRSNITIIPQVPELLSGTLRANLDIFGVYDDAELNHALRSAGLFSLQSEDDDGRITLDSMIASGGSNLSVGQRQILALARAILRGSKLLILDEATSAIDYKTDAIIQNSLRTQLGSDVTIVTIAHRLQTIMDADKIMVLDAGRIVEFGRPKELLKNKTGVLRALVDESNDRDTLYEMAEK